MKLRGIHIFTLVALLGLFVPAWSQDRLESIVRRVDARFSKMADQDGFSGVIYVGKGEKELLNKGYGWANPKKKEPNSPEKRFMIASVSKAFTAAAILQLQEAGQLDVHAPIGTYIPDYPHWNGENITLHHLLTHTSGIPDYINDFPLEFKIRQVLGWTPTKDDLISTFQDRPLNFYPGEGFKYSNSGYVLLAKVIENVTGEDYDTYLWNHILEPLGMERSGLGDFNLIGNRAVAHQGSSTRHKVINNFKYQWIYGMGEMYATASDLHRWLVSFQDDRILSDSSRKQMFTPFHNNYAYGWHILDAHGHLQYSHGGYLPGWNSYVFYYPEDTLSLVILSNNDNTNPLVMGQEVTEVLFRNELHLLEEFSAPGQIAGRYAPVEAPAAPAPIEAEILTVNSHQGNLELRTPVGETLYFIPSDEGWKEESNGGLNLSFQNDNNRILLEVTKDGQHWQWQKLRGGWE